SGSCSSSTARSSTARGSSCSRTRRRRTTGCCARRTSRDEAPLAVPVPVHAGLPACTSASPARRVGIEVERVKFSVCTLPSAPVDELVRRWHALDDLQGIDAIWLPDQLAPRPGLRWLEAWTLLGALARETKRVRSGPLVSPLNLRNPAVLARAAVTLDELSGGRAELGVGAGGAPRDQARLPLRARDAVAQRGHVRRGRRAVARRGHGRDRLRLSTARRDAGRLGRTGAVRTCYRPSQRISLTYSGVFSGGGPYAL